MRTLPFSLLVMACFSALMLLRLALPEIARRAPEAVSAPGEAMAVPPKPAGLAPPPAPASEDGSGGAALSEAACLQLAASVQDLCWQSLARQEAAQSGGRPDGALSTCDRIRDAEMQTECRSDVAEATAPADRDRAAAICAGISAVKWRGQCNFGIGLALAEIDPPDAFARCDQAEIFRLFCRHDVIGEIALADTPAAHALCTRDDTPDHTDLARKTCWHGVGKYLARRDAAEAARACQDATPAWIGACFHGLGWGAAERDPDATLSFCEQQGEWRDPCRQGVAHQQKRTDPERALALCKSIGTESVRRRCLEFVQR